MDGTSDTGAKAVTKKMEKGGRRFYLSGPNEGQVRPSKRTRRRRRWQQICSRHTGDEAIEDLVEQVETKGFDGAAGELGQGEGVLVYRLAGGYRESRGSATRYGMDVDDDEDWRMTSHGRLVTVEVHDIRSGKRWFREGYPDGWMEEYTRRGREKLASRRLDDYGKEFVEYDGHWYEARSV